MSNLTAFLTAVRDRLVNAPMTINPYVTDRGGVIILNGPFKFKDAIAIAELLKYARADLTRLLALVEVAQKVARAAKQMVDGVDIPQSDRKETSLIFSCDEVEAVKNALARWHAAVEVPHA